jgi:predicted nucleic acid-binding protein
MACYLVDTNVLLRRVQPASPDRAAARLVLRSLYADGHDLCVAAQNLTEFWTVATRGASRGGLALTPEQAHRHVVRLRSAFRFLPDTPDVFDQWLALALESRSIDVHAFDTRLVAVMRVHGLTHIVTFNADDFRRFVGVEVVDPRQAVQQRSVT